MLPGVADQEGIRFVDTFGPLNDPALSTTHAVDCAP